MKNIILVIIVIMFSSCYFFSAGSYPYAKYYQLNMSTDELIDNIKRFKQGNPQYKTIVNGIEAIDTISGNNFYTASFYITEERMVLYGVINLNGDIRYNEDASIGLDGILDAFKTDSAEFYKLKELPKEKRENVINIFETEILDKLGYWKRN